LNRSVTDWTRENVVEIFTHDAYTANAEPVETDAAVKLVQSIDRLLRGAKTSETSTNKLGIVGETTEINVMIRRWPDAEQLGYKQAEDATQRDALFAGDATSLVQISFQTNVAGYPMLGFGSQLGFVDEQAARAWLANSPTVFLELDPLNNIPERQYLETLPRDLFGGREYLANAFLWNVPTGLVVGLESRVVDGAVVSTFAFVNPQPLPIETALRDLLGGAEDSDSMQLINRYLSMGYSNSKIYYEVFGGDIADHPEFLAALIAHRAAYFSDVPVQQPPQPSEEEPALSVVGKWIDNSVVMS
jgi:hypothetical protein